MKSEIPLKNLTKYRENKLPKTWGLNKKAKKKNNQNEIKKEKMNQCWEDVMHRVKVRKIFTNSLE